MVSNRDRLFQWSIFRCKALVFEGAYQQQQQYLPSPFCSCWWHPSWNGQIFQLPFLADRYSLGPRLSNQKSTDGLFQFNGWSKLTTNVLHFWLFCIIHRELLTKGCNVKQFLIHAGDSSFMGHDTSNIQQIPCGRNLGWQDGVVWTTI